MPPPKRSSSPAQPAGAGVTGEWKVAQRKGTARQAQQPQKAACVDVSAVPKSRTQQSVSTGGAAASGFTRPGA
eukprot:11391992-Alexandrium_andersonii.AAC.1